MSPVYTPPYQGEGNHIMFFNKLGRTMPAFFNTLRLCRSLELPRAMQGVEGRVLTTRFYLTTTVSQRGEWLFYEEYRS